MFEISGVHHVAIGVKDAGAMKAFYQGVLGFKSDSAESAPAPHAVMSGIMRGITPIFAASMFSLEGGGILVEFILMQTPAPRPIRRDFRYGDIGVNKITLAVKDVAEVYGRLKNSLSFCNGPKSVEIPAWGTYSFVYARDPEGNLIEFAAGPGFKCEDKAASAAALAGARADSIGISVTDLERSLAFYQKCTGFDILLIPPHESFSGQVDEISGGRSSQVRSCLLSSTRGGGMIELFEMLSPRGRSIPSYTIWGDFGYHQTCLLCKNVPEIAGRFEKEGLDFALNLQRMPGESAAFTYVRDPDGIILEYLSFKN